MNDEANDGRMPPGAPDIGPSLRLRGAPPRVTRLSRKVLIGLGGISALAIAGAIGYALQTRHGRDTGQELYVTENRPAADGLATLPKDYTGVPRQVPPLGPALPGDLGRPILSAQNQGLSVATPKIGAHDNESQRQAQETETARVSRLFVQTQQQPGSIAQTVAGVATQASSSPTAAAQTPPVDGSASQNMQDRKLAFVDGAIDRNTVSSDRLAAPVSPYVVQAGAVIPAALITGIHSDLPGQITAQVTENVYDSPTGNYLLIPQGARLIGQYDSSVAFGQNRVLLVWTRLIMPNGNSIVLDRLEGADSQGYSGLEDATDYHWGMLFKAAILSTLLSVGAEAGTSSDENNLVQAIRSGASNSVSQTGQQIVQHELNIQPTLTLRPGLPLRVVVDHDLVLAPYSAGGVP